MIRSIAAFIIDFNTCKDAEKLSRQIATTDHGHFSVKVFHVDNGSQVAVMLSPTQVQAGVVLIRNDENRGYAGGFTTALKKRRDLGEGYDAYWLLNSDLGDRPFGSGPLI